MITRPLTTLSNVVHLKRGYDLPDRNRNAGHIPVLGSFGITGWHDVAKSPGPGVTIGRSGASIGVATYYDGPFWPLNTTLYVTDFKGNVPRFVYYLLEWLDFRDFNSGSAQPSLNRNHLTEIKVCAFTPLEQARIAETLGVIDDLIENNRRRVEVLEQMTRAIYREWFVRFRYPGFEDVPLVDSPLGRIPQGWAVSTCGDELTALGGGTPSKKEASYWDGGDVRWFTPSDLTKSRLRYAAEPEMKITRFGLARSSARLFPAGSVLMTSRATLGVLAISTVEATTNQGFIVFPPDDRWSPGFIYEWLDWHADDLASVATGSTFKEITKGAFKRLPFVVPVRDVLDAHRKMTEPLEEQIRVLEERTRTLAALRELLLPNLVTGRIDVSHLDLEVPAGTASA